jgi:threonine synthase
MKFISTRDKNNIVNFSEALFQGLAPDGGLYVPQEKKDLSALFDSFDENTSFVEIATEMTYSLLGDTFTKDQAKSIAERAFTFKPEIVNLENNISILELFHGNSCAFKDYGASFLALTMETLLDKKEDKAVILTATSGDTGSAVAQAFVGKKNVEVVILYPSGRVSPLQEKQLTTLGSNIKALEVKGSFDDCQRMVKDAFIDKDITSKINLSSANSINLGRLIPQSFYYVWAYSQIKKTNNNTVFVVPSGNFGNLTAALYAQSWGLKIKNYVAATNANDVIPKYLKEGIYKPLPSIHTISNAMDVGSPSNYERMSFLFEENVKKFNDKIEAFSISDDETKAIIKKVYNEEKYILCPHTAVGYGAAKLYKEKHPDSNIMVLATAHPGKFTEVIEEVISVKPELPEELQKLESRKKVATLIEGTSEALKSYLLTTY